MHSQEQIYAALKSLNYLVFNKIRALDISTDLLETQAGSSATAAIAAASSNDTIPLPPHQSRWFFALLAFLDDYLPPDEIADLRNIAKTCLRIVKWQVISGHIGPDGKGVTREHEEMRSSCWIIHRAIGVGWGQKDLSTDAEAFFARLRVPV